MNLITITSSFLTLHDIRNWSFAVFYVMAEMWGSVVASLLFWSFANEVTTVEEAKKYCECIVLLYDVHEYELYGFKLHGIDS